MGESEAPLQRMVKLLDQSRCIGCHACTTACKSENEVPLGVTRTYVKSVDVGLFPDVRRAFQVTRCNQCQDAPCVSACPTQAMFMREDGIVDFDKSVCIGCKACIAACPYDAIFINPEDHSAEKCNLCAHRLDIGLEPACVTVCPADAITVGDLNDPDSEVARIIREGPVQVRKPEQGTRPAVFYAGASQETLDPLAARRADGGLLAWATLGTGSAGPGAAPARAGRSGQDRPVSSAAALLSYDIPHQAPWGWRVSLYTWTKSVAAGAFAVPVAMALFGALGWGHELVRWVAPVVSLAFLAVTGALLIGDLKHPMRFYLILTRPQWRSWLVRGAVLLGAYAIVVGLYLLARLAGPGSLDGDGAQHGLAWAGSAARVLAWAGLPLAVAAAVYTAFLFAQARARELWRSPLLAPHLAVQALLAGAAVTVLLARWLAPADARELAGDLLAGAAAAHLLTVMAEARTGHRSEHAALAVAALTRGRYGRYFWPAAAMIAVALAAPWLGSAAWVAAVLALGGLLAYEHGYVQAGQAVPLA
jgi:Fe-S-cluster-containing dehydrogenase component/formate-dependent nitrite reductase membrane component NrfD